MTKARSERTLRLGRAADSVGYISIPIMIGIVVGYFLSDRGIRFLPTLLSILTLTGAASCFCLLLGRIIRGKTHHFTGTQLVLHRSISLLLMCSTLLLGLRVAIYWSELPSPLTALDRDDFAKVYSHDKEQYFILSNGLSSTIDHLEGQQELFSSKRVLTATEEAHLTTTWSSIYNYAIALDQIRLYYEDWFRFDISRAERRFHIKSFLLTFAAELTLFESAIRLVKLFEPNQNVRKHLNSDHANSSLPNDSWSLFRQTLHGERDHLRVLAGQEYMRFLRIGFQGFSEAVDLGLGPLWLKNERTIASISTRSTIFQAIDSVKSDLEPIRRTITRVWYPTQSRMAEWMGDTRIRRIGKYLISEDLLEEMDTHLKPGDILLARKNWYLSNVGLPGFWPHAEIYLGDPQKLVQYFDDPEVIRFWKEVDPTFTTFDQYLETRFPQAWWRYTQHKTNQPYRVIESTSDGVIFSTLYNAAGDYVAGLRPNLSKVNKSQAIVQAFEDFGKPYDYNFDFATQDKLVCTELVWRAYRPGLNKEGLNLPTIRLMGRDTLPANNIAALFAEEKGQDEPQFEFVYFIDAREKSNQAIQSNEAEFINSHQRIKWDILLE